MYLAVTLAVLRALVLTIFTIELGRGLKARQMSCHWVADSVPRIQQVLQTGSRKNYLVQAQ